MAEKSNLVLIGMPGAGKSSMGVVAAKMLGMDFIDCDLLILDDLGTEFGTRFSTAAMYNMINSRMITSKPTIISTNLTMKELQESYGSRVTSRLIGGLKRLEFCGRDIRQLKRMKPLPTGDT